MKSNDFVKYLTVQVVEHLDKPREPKLKKKRDISLSTHWFGVIPISLKIIFSRFQKKT